MADRVSREHISLVGEDLNSGIVTAGWVIWYEPTPETAPDAIIAAHVEIVRDYVRRAGRCTYPRQISDAADLQKISDAVDLPVWNVRRCLEILGWGPPVEGMGALYAARKAARSLRDKIAALLAENPMSVDKIAFKLGLSQRTIADCLHDHPEFALVGHVKRTMGAKATWGLMRRRGRRVPKYVDLPGKAGRKKI